MLAGEHAKDLVGEALSHRIVKVSSTSPSSFRQLNSTPAYGLFPDCQGGVRAIVNVALLYGVAGPTYDSRPGIEEMDAETSALLARLIRGERIAHLGTLRQGAPMVSMTLYLPEPDFAAFHVHVSRLAWHTQDMGADARVALSIAQTDDAREDPFTLARVTIRGEAAALPNEGAEFERLKKAWLERFPQQAVNFELADFSFWRIAPRDARFVAGFGRIHNLGPDALRAAAQGNPA